MKWAAVAFAVAAVLTVERRVHACAGCSNPNLPTARAANVDLAPGEVSAAVNVTGTTMRVVQVSIVFSPVAAGKPASSSTS